jgi:hypothetical protein
MRKRLLVVLCSALLVACCSSSDSDDTVRSGSGPSPASTSDSGPSSSEPNPEPASAPPATSPMLEVQGKVNIPDGEADKLSVVAVGKPDGDSVPVVIRNRTAEPLSALEVTGTARGAGGALIASGSSQGFAPALIQPGEWAFGYVYFGGPKLSPDTEYDLTATGQEPDDFGSVDVQIVEVSTTSGAFGDQFVGIMKNPSTTDQVGGPVGVMVGCFDKSGTLFATHSSFAEADSIPAGGTSSFSIDLFDDPCPNWAMGASGFTF